MPYNCGAWRTGEIHIWCCINRNRLVIEILGNVITKPAVFHYLYTKILQSFESFIFIILYKTNTVNSKAVSSTTVHFKERKPMVSTFVTAITCTVFLCHVVQLAIPAKKSDQKEKESLYNKCFSCTVCILYKSIWNSMPGLHHVTHQSKEQ
mgnify:CR=1 FL=1